MIEFRERITARPSDFVDDYIVEREAEGWILASRVAVPNVAQARFIPANYTDHDLVWSRPEGVA